MFDAVFPQHPSALESQLLCSQAPRRHASEFLFIRHIFAYTRLMEYSPRNREKDGRTLVLAAAIIVGLRLA